jgi:hypothetical protein
MLCWENSLGAMDEYLMFVSILQRCGIFLLSTILAFLLLRSLLPHESSTIVRCASSPGRFHPSSLYNRRHQQHRMISMILITTSIPISFFNGWIIASVGYGEHTGIGFLSQSSLSSFATASSPSPK